LRSSYGWLPARFAEVGAERPVSKEPRFLFVGSVCVRKGAHLLAAAWSEAKVRGRLTVAGRIAGGFVGAGAALVRGPNIEYPGHCVKIPELMSASDAFVFPTLEEGSPLVVYEAAAMGLAIVTTPMGAGEVLRDGAEAIVREPTDRRGWVE